MSEITIRLSTTDKDRYLALLKKKVSPGLQESEKEELKQLEVKMRQIK